MQLATCGSTCGSQLVIKTRNMNKISWPSGSTASEPTSNKLFNLSTASVRH
jgi:hypothetical protein